jgi:hypothetical protein
MLDRTTRLALLALALAGCAPTTGTTPQASTASSPGGDWIARAAATVRVSDDIEDTRDCEFVSVLVVPAGWDGELKGMTPAEENALNEMKRAAAQAGGNFVLLYPGPEPSGEAYLCTE